MPWAPSAAGRSGSAVFAWPVMLPGEQICPTLHSEGEDGHTDSYKEHIVPRQKTSSLKLVSLDTQDMLLLMSVCPSGDRTRIPARSVTKTLSEARDSWRWGARKQLMPSVLCKPHLFRNTLIFATVSPTASNTAPNYFSFTSWHFLQNPGFAAHSKKGVEFNAERLCLTQLWGLEMFNGKHCLLTFF